MAGRSRFDQYLEHLSLSLGHADRVAGLRGYCTGLMMPLERKSVEPMAAGIDPQRASARHQSLHHFVAKADWSDALLGAVAAWVLPKMNLDEAVWIIDDTGPRRASTPWALRDSTADSLASRTTVSEFTVKLCRLRSGIATSRLTPQHNGVQNAHDSGMRLERPSRWARCKFITDKWSESMRNGLSIMAFPLVLLVAPLLAAEEPPALSFGPPEGAMTEPAAATPGGPIAPANGVAAQLSFGHVLSDTEISAVLARHSAMPRAAFIYIAGLSATHRVYGDMQAEAFLQQARQQFAKSLDESINENLKNIDRFVATNPEETIRDSSGLQQQARSLLVIRDQLLKARQAVGAAQPLVFAIEVQGAAEEIEGLRREALVVGLERKPEMTRLSPEQPAPATRGLMRSLKPSEYKGPYRNATLEAASGADIYLGLTAAAAMLGSPKE